MSPLCCHTEEHYSVSLSVAFFIFCHPEWSETIASRESDKEHCKILHFVQNDSKRFIQSS